MFVRIWWVIIIFILAYCLYYERIIMAEEAFLKNKFGTEYEDYLSRTPAFFPNFNLWQPNILPFSFRHVLKCEYHGFFAVIAAFMALEFIGDYIVYGSVVFDPVWVTIFTLGLFTYITLRTIRKKTRLLHVEGRSSILTTYET